VALGESATTIVELDTRDPAHPRIASRWQPGFTVHDLHFSPRGAAVWLSSATGPDVTVVNARTHAVRFRIPVGRPPQHIAFGPGGAYLTSGYGSVIERADPTSGRILDRARSPYGSFELDARGDYVVVASLLRGTLAIFDPRLRLRRTEPLAPATREVAIAAMLAIPRKRLDSLPLRDQTRSEVRRVNAMPRRGRAAHGQTLDMQLSTCLLSIAWATSSRRWPIPPGG
jgi:hypothetical protein